MSGDTGRAKFRASVAVVPLDDFVFYPDLRSLHLISSCRYVFDLVCAPWGCMWYCLQDIKVVAPAAPAADLHILAFRGLLCQARFYHRKSSSSKEEAWATLRGSFTPRSVVVAIFYGLFRGPTKTIWKLAIGPPIAGKIGKHLNDIMRCMYACMRCDTITRTRFCLL